MSTLTDDELHRIRYECGEHLLAIGAEPYIAHAYVFDLVRDYCASSSVAATTSATTVASAGPCVLTLATVAGLAQFDKLNVDCDDSRETVTIRSITGSTISVICRKPHSGTYPVEKESALTIVRGLLSDLTRIEIEGNDVTATGGLRKVDEVEFFGNDGQAPITGWLSARAAMRASLAGAIGLTDLLRNNTSGGSSNYEVY